MLPTGDEGVDVSQGLISKAEVQKRVTQRHFSEWMQQVTIDIHRYPNSPAI